MKSSIGRTAIPAADELPGGAAGGDDLHPQLHQAAREVHDAPLVGDREQRARHAHLARPRERGAVESATGGRPSGRSIGNHPDPGGALAHHHPPRMAGLQADRPARDEPHRLGQQLVLQRAQGRAHLVGVARAGELERALEDDRAAVDALVDEVHGDPEDLHPVLQRILDRPDPGEGGQQGRVDVDRPGPGSGPGSPR